MSALRVSREFWLNGKHYAVGAEVTAEEVGDFAKLCAPVERVSVNPTIGFVVSKKTEKPAKKADEKKDEKKDE